MEQAGIELAVSLIGSLGFPIVCCFFLWKYINETMKEFTKIMSDNTIMLQKLCERMDDLKEERRMERYDDTRKGCGSDGANGSR